MEEIREKIQEAGLSIKESEIYLTLLKSKPIGGGQLSKQLKIDRTHTYNILRNLINKGLVSYIIICKKTLFRANSPKNLLNQIQKKEQIIKSIIPELESLEAIKPEKSEVRVLEGKPGLRTTIQMLLESKPKEILVYGGTGKSYDILKYEMPHVTKKIKSLNMKGRIITSEKLKGHPFTKLSNFKIKYIQEITPSSTMIFENKIAINVFHNNIFVILIENKFIADSYKRYFEYLWKIAKR